MVQSARSDVLLQHEIACRSVQADLTLAGCSCIAATLGTVNKVPAPMQVAHIAHNAWQNLPDPATLDASSLNLPRIMGPILSAASPNATHLYSKLLVVHAPATGAPALPAAWLLSKLRKRWDHDAKPQVKNTGDLQRDQQQFTWPFRHPVTLLPSPAEPCPPCVQDSKD